MPVIRVGLDDFRRLVGLRLSLSRLREEIPMMGLGWERDDPEGFEVEVFPNRPDMLSPEGLARAYKGFIGLERGVPDYVVKHGFYEAYVDAAVKSVRPYIAFVAIKNVPMDEEVFKSIIQVQEKLHISYCRNRRKGSIGVHDLDKLKPPVRYTVKPLSFRFRPLDSEEEMSIREILRRHPKGVEYGHLLSGFKYCPILEDSQGMVLSMPPVINSEYTRVTLETKNLFIDCTGLDWKTVNSVLNIIATSLAERGCQIYTVKIHYPYDTPVGKEVETPDLAPSEMKLPLSLVDKVFGEHLDAEEVVKLLAKMRFDAVKLSEGELLVKVPAYRVDIMHPVDLVEDVIIAYGYNRIEPEIPQFATIGGESRLERFSSKVRSIMVGLGYQEVMTEVLTNPRDLFVKMRVKPGPVVELENPKTVEYTVCRSWLLPSLMKVLARNRHREYPQRIFEVDDVVILDESSETGGRSLRKLAAVSIHSEADYAEVKAVVDTLLDILAVEHRVEPEIHPSFIDGRTGFIKTLKGETVGFLGEIHPEVLINFGLENPAVGFEIDLEAVMRLKGFGRRP